MSDNNRFPEIIVFAGPNGSGKTTVTKLAKVIEPYINADDIKRTVHCSDLDAAVMAEKMREEALAEYRDFTFETVMSTDRNLNLLRRAKEQGYFIRCIYVLTSDPNINVSRVRSREQAGGHGVPEERIRARYEKARDILPPLEEVGASCSMALSSQVSTGYPRLSGGSFVMSSYALSRIIFSFSRCLPSSRIFLAALMSRS